MTKNTEVDNSKVRFKTAENYTIDIFLEHNKSKTTISSPRGNLIANISETKDNSDYHFDYSCSLMLDDGTEIYFQNNESENQKLQNGIYIISDDILFYSEFISSTNLETSKSKFRELELSSIEFDLLYLEDKEDKKLKMYHYSDAKWLIIQANGDIDKIAYESFGNFQKKNEEIKSTEEVDTSLKDKIEALDENTLILYRELETLKATRSKKESFFNYYFEQGVDEIILKIFIQLTRDNETEEKFLKLDNYVREIHGLDDELSQEEEEKQIITYLFR